MQLRPLTAAVSDGPETLTQAGLLHRRVTGSAHRPCPNDSMASTSSDMRSVPVALCGPWAVQTSLSAVAAASNCRRTGVIG